MNATIDISNLDNLKYMLYTSAKALSSVWNDKQYDYFLQHYVRPVTNDVQAGIEVLNNQLVPLRVIVEELESLAGRY